MIIDIHTHLFPDKIAERSIAFLEATCGEKAFHNGTLSGLQAVMKKADVAVAFAMPVVTKPAQFESILRFAVSVTENTRTSPQRIVSFGGIHPDTDNFKKELDAIKAAGLPGVKLHPAYQRTNIDHIKNLRIISYAQEIGLWVLIHTGKDPLIPERSYATPADSLKMLRQTGGNKLILAHMGGLEEWDDAEEYLIGENVYLDTALGFSLMEPSRMKRMIQNHGADRVFFGTDSPWADMKSAREAVKACGLTEEEAEAVLWKNALSVYQTGDDSRLYRR